MASVKNRGRGNAPAAFPEGSAWERPGFLLWHATLRWKRIVAAVLADLELTHVQFVLLAGTLWLEHKGAPPSQRELADHAGTDEMMTSQVLRTLAKRGLISRTVDEADARIKRVRTTAEGADLAVRAVKLVESADAEVFGDTTNKSLLAALRRIARRDLDGTTVATRAGA